ncbi:MAG: polyprenyl synthetase family protein [Phycisphaerales bacterium]|jgi:octaprenyl-diphosphate synthase|nr:polyprenyl synthetase family protein [Phycisphaerales bacterium]
MPDSSADLLAAVADCIGPELAEVEKLFHLELASGFKCVDALVRHVSRFRGKMLRPMLVLLTGKACGKLTPSHITIATVVEMVHMATLVHDDVLDEAELRRKGATINHLRGNESAVLLGDYLISHSYHLCSSLDSQMASRAIARTTNQVCEGELLQIDNRNNLDLDEKTYTQIITHKTAVLCAACCQLGATLAGASADTISRMERFGLSLGIAFQIQDDILDILGHTSQVGKTLGIDIEKGKMTLPMIHFMKTAPREHRELLRSLLTIHEPDQVEKIRNLILPSDSIDYARNQARQYTQQARRSIAGLPDSPAKDVLDAMADFVICRTI